jgi:hypothetical protein
MRKGGPREPGRNRGLKSKPSGKFGQLHSLARMRVYECALAWPAYGLHQAIADETDWHARDFPGGFDYHDELRDQVKRDPARLNDSGVSRLFAGFCGGAA